MEFSTVQAELVKGLGFECQIQTSTGVKITFRLLDKKGVRLVRKSGFLTREDFLAAHKRACQEISKLQHQQRKLQSH